MRPPPSRSVEHRITTRDHRELSIYEFSPEILPSPFRPLILVHGLGANAYNMASPTYEANLAEYLSIRGHHVWLLEMRGTHRAKHVGKHRQKPRHSFDDHVFYDAPAGIEFVCQQTHSPEIHWAGHSLGGMVAYGYILNGLGDHIKRLVTFGAPSLGSPLPVILQLAAKTKPLARFIPRLPITGAAFIAKYTPRLFRYVTAKFSSHGQNISKEDVYGLASMALEPIETTLLVQLANYGHEIQSGSNSSKFLYWNHLDKITCPTMLIAGTKDYLTPLKEIERTCEAIGAHRKELVICGKDNGFELDYGHIDLVLARNARKEIYPHVARWFEDPNLA
ncbi:MAG: alpha/beta fold hydrolase [Myxococcota bacterium]|nr:alpha/beta fold hydrolase [Myxococcota bacterium]